MREMFITEAIDHMPKLKTDKISFTNIDFRKIPSSVKLIFNANCIIFSLHGVGRVTLLPEKIIRYTDSSCQRPEEILSFGGTTEAQTREFTHLMVLFPTPLINDFLFRKFVYPDAGSVLPSLPNELKQGPFLADHVQLLSSWIHSKISISNQLVEHKFEELLLLLSEQFSIAFFSCFLKKIDPSGQQIKQVIEDKLMENLSIEELAVKTHKSLSSFKREFERIYGISPGKYIREKKLEVAAHAILNGKKTSEIYMDFGYETTSNFIYAFKRKFNCTPKEFKNRTVCC